MSSPTHLIAEHWRLIVCFSFFFYISLFFGYVCLTELATPPAFQFTLNSLDRIRIVFDQIRLSEVLT